MATALQTITKALRTARILASGEDPTNDEAADALTALNEMLFQWRLDGLDIAHISLASGDTIEVPDDHLQILRLCLAERLAGEYGTELAPRDLMAAETGKGLLRAYYFAPTILTMDSALLGRD